MLLSFFKRLWLGVCLLISWSSMAQNTIQLYDAQTGQLLAGVRYQTNETKGISNIAGEVVLPAGTTILHLIPMDHEAQVVQGGTLAAALQAGRLLLAPLPSISLLPVSVYALRGKGTSNKKILATTDWIHHDAGQVVQQIPGFAAIRKSNIYGAEPVFRGMKLGQLNVITDGAMSAIAACPNRMDPPTSQVMLSQVQDIELLKGPHSFRYGPASGAVIHFRSAPAAYAEKANLSGRVSSSYESNGELFRLEGKATYTNKRNQVHLTASHSTGNDYRDGNDSIIPAGFNRSAFGLQATHAFSSQDEWSVSIFRNHAGNARFPTLMMDLLSDDTWMAQTQYTHRWKSGPIRSLSVQAYGSYVDHIMGTALRVQTMSKATSTTNTQTLGGRAELAWKKGRFQGYSGLDFRHEAADGYRVRTMLMGPMAGRSFRDTLWQDGELSRGGAFTEGYIALGQFKLHLAGRVDFHQAEAHNLGTKFSKTSGKATYDEVNTSLSVGLSRQWNKNWFTGVWIGRGVRPATLSERFINYLAIGVDPYELVGRIDLKNEANNQVDLVVKFQNERTRVHWSAFAGLMSNYITSVIDPSKQPSFGGPGVRMFMNLDQALLYGFEWQWEQSWSPYLQQQTSLSYTYGRNESTHTPLPEIAPLALQLQLTGNLGKNKWHPFLITRYVAEQNRVAVDFGERKTGDFATLDAGLNAELTKNISVSLLINNIFDRAYREHLSRFIRPTLPLNAPGRSALITLSYAFR